MSENDKYKITIGTLQYLVFKEYQKNGYHKMWSNNFSNKITQTEKIFDIAELGLIITEVSEAMEEIRKNGNDNANLFFECADIIIRTLNFMTRKGASASFFLIEKNEKNINRRELHGKQV